MSNAASHAGRTVTRRLSNSFANRRAGGIYAAGPCNYDPSTSISQLFDGDWVEYVNSEKKARLSAMHLPFMLQRFMLRTKLKMSIKLQFAGLFFTVYMGVVSQKLELKLGTPSRTELSLLGVKFESVTLAKRGLGGAYKYHVQQHFNGNTFTIDNELNPNIKGNSIGRAFQTQDAQVPLCIARSHVLFNTSPRRHKHFPALGCALALSLTPIVVSTALRTLRLAR
ncbi:hypothetical protein N9O24_00540 [bacterium]|nr:hypothetical protein [bacterium]